MRYINKEVFLFLACSILVHSTLAHDTGLTNELKALKQDVIKLTNEMADLKITAKNKADFWSHFGIGLSLTYDLGSHDRVKSAEVDGNGIVRVSADDDLLPRFILEVHQNWWEWNGANNKVFLPNRRYGLGPWIGVVPGGSDIVDAIGGGVVFSVRAKEINQLTDRLSFNVGIGIMFDPNVKILGDGIKRDKPLPVGDTLRFRETDQFGVSGMLSFNLAF